MPVRHRLLALALIAAALVTALVAGCGGGSEGDAKALLKRGFAASIPSANVTIDLSAKIDGVPQLSQPIRAKLGGPYKSNGPKTIPSLNWDVSISGGGQTFSIGLISDGDRGFVNFQGTNYEIDKTTMDRLKAASAQSSPNGSRSLSQFGVDPLSWVKDATVEGDSDVAGVATKHVSAGIDVQRLFKDLNKVVEKAGGSVGAARPSQLTPQVIDQIKNVVKNPKFDAYVGKTDNKIRRASVSLDFEVPKAAQAGLRGIQGGNLTLSIEFASVGAPQTIQAPTNAKPISELANQLRGLGGALGATGGIGGSGTGAGGSNVPGQPGGATGGGNAPTSAQFKRYAACLNKAKPSDTAALQRCSNLLK
ncbi:MAG: hypothetical protein QOG41_568 [Thermoleophilaceae bacterium]|nr:hypothetical protein [Thermoleophilaceae bacterium]